MAELTLTFKNDASGYINIFSGGISKSCYLTYQDSDLRPVRNSILVNENTSTSYTSNCDYIIFSDSELLNSYLNNPPYDVYCIIIHSVRKIFYVQNGEPKILNYSLVGSHTITCDNSWSINNKTSSRLGG